MNDLANTNLLLALEAYAGDSENVRFHNDYSGRGMYGKSCVGISGDAQECNAVFCTLIQELAEDLVQHTEEGNGGHALKLYKETVEALYNHRTDSFGRGIILYWPSISSEPVTSDEE